MQRRPQLVTLALLMACGGASAPPPPTKVIATAGNGQAQVSWTAPTGDGGSPILHYLVTATPGGAPPVTVDGATTSVTVTGLTNGVAYSFTVVATNAAGSSGASAPSSQVTPIGPPEAPTAVTATPVNGRVELSWTAPLHDGGSPILHYRVTATPGGATLTTSDGATTSASMEGLPIGTAHTFTVVASNALGDSAPSAPSAKVIGIGVPDAPTAVSATANLSQVVVTWAVPASDGGNPISSYTVTASPGGATATSGGLDRFVVFTALPLGTAYTFTVVATNAAGDSAASAPSLPATPVGYPEAPASATATAGNRQAVITWTPPPDNGGSPITGYIISGGPNVISTDASTTLATVTGLANGTTYQFFVSAQTAIGEGPAVPTLPVTPVGVPDAPVNVLVQRGDGRAWVSWTPSSDNGSPILSYRVSVSPGGATVDTPNPQTQVTGLTNGVSYTFQVIALNAVGDSAWSQPSAPIVPATTPDAPSNVTARGGNGQAQVSWDPPASNGGDPVTHYTVIASTGDVIQSAADGSTTLTFTGLSNGTAYTFRVIAYNSVGGSPLSLPSSPVTPAAVPAAPTAVTATRGDRQVQLNWTASASDGGQPILRYTVTANPGGLTVSTADGATTTATVSGLSNGTTYTFSVVATNAAGDSVPSSPAVSATPATVPDAPTAVSATRGDGQLQVRWTAPSSDGGSALLHYTVSADPGGATVTTADGSTTFAIVPGLSNGTAYTFTVVATNAVGTSAASAPSAAITPATVPDAPTAVRGTRGDHQLKVDWTAPASDGGAAILHYTVTANPGGATVTTADGASTTATVTGLTNGTAYTFTVVATNPVGDSLPSTPSAPAVPATVPDPPTAVTATGGNGQVVVGWTAPASTGGSPIVHYAVTASPGGATVTTADGATTTATVTGLTNGTAYTFTVLATNGIGDSVPSVPSPKVTPMTVPSAPAGVTATRGNGQVTVGWSAPASDGGSAIVHYTVTASPGGATMTTADGLSTSVIVTGLANGTAYTFSVVATNQMGDSLPSAPSAPVVPATFPDAPSAVTATAGNAQAVVGWTAPASNGGSAILHYTVTASPGGATVTTADGAATTATVIGLSNGTAYTFTVVATNEVGNSAASVPSPSVTPITVPSAPTAVAGARGNGQVGVSWNAPASDGGSAILHYTVTATPGGATVTTADGATTTATVTGLTNGIAYTFQVVATNRAGDSPPSTASSPVTPATSPGAPTGVSGTRGDAAVTVSWIAPSSDGGSAILHYTAVASPGGASAITATGSATSVTVTGLTNGVAYTFTVRATNAVGDSAPSAGSAAVTPLGPPSAPSNPAATAGNAQATVSWTASASNGGSPIQRYSVWVSPGGLKVDTADGTTTTATVTGLTNGTAYTFQVTATNAIGTSAPSGASNPVTPLSPPGPPTGVVAAPGHSQAVVGWSAPATNGGTAITSYQVTASPGGATVTTADGTTTSATVTGLSNGTAYSFTVKAANTQGTSPASVPSAPVTPYGAADASRSKLVASPPAAFANSVSAVSLTLVARDAAGRAIGLAPTSLTSTTGYDVLTPPSGTSSLGGVFRSKLTGFSTGTRTVSAVIDSDTETAAVTLVPACTNAFNLGASTDANTGAGPLGLTMADFNLDGVLDVATADASGDTVSILLGTGTGTFTRASHWPGLYALWAIASGDLNGDGAPDLVILEGDGTGLLSVMLGNGDGTFQAPATYTADTHSQSLVTGDFNRDGYDDVAIAGFNSSRVFVFFGEADGALRTVRYADSVTLGSAITAADFNGDGKLDLATTQSGTPKLNILLGNGNGTFEPPQQVSFSASDDTLAGVAAGDLNGDGKADLVGLLIGAPGSCVTLLGTGTGTFTPAGTRPLPLFGDALALGDLNGDGKLDVVTSQSNDTLTSGSISVMLGVGDGTLGTPSTLSAGEYPGPVAIGDLNGDGKPDVITPDGNASVAKVFLNGCF